MAPGLASPLFALAALLSTVADVAAYTICADRLYFWHPPVPPQPVVGGLPQQPAHGHGHDHDHLSPTEESTWMDLMPRKARGGGAAAEDAGAAAQQEFDWLKLYRKMTRGSPEPDNTGARAVLSEVSLHDVRLDPDTMYWRAQQTNLEYLLLLDPDRLVWSFRRHAGLRTIGAPYGGWEAPNQELRGHFVGHFLSATARMWASTHNETVRQRMTQVVDALDECQKKVGTGYLSAFPEELFHRFEILGNVWSPYYTMHKIMQGLLDQHVVAGNPKALGMVVWMVEYFSNRVKNIIQNYTITWHYNTLNEEFGGMNDVLYQLYTITKDQKHLTMAHLFDKPCFLGALAVQDDDISGMHANTHIPIVVGAQTGYEVTGDHVLKTLSTFFFDAVNSSHSFATGGTSTAEHWGDPKRVVSLLGEERSQNEESCTTYNMLKIARNLFRWTKDVEYTHYYERALVNGVLSIQRGTQPGVMIYYLPVGPGRSKADSGWPPYYPGGWGNPENKMWCCYGTATESFSKLGDSIYFVEQGQTPVLYIVQFIPSTFNWKAAGLTARQQVNPVTSTDSYIQVSITISPKAGAKQATVNVRIPSWTSVESSAAALNGEGLNLTAISADGYMSITRAWAPNDNLVIQFAIGLWTEPVKDDRPGYESIQAILFGPFLLAGLSRGDWTVRTGGSDVAASRRSDDARSVLSDWITPIPPTMNSDLVSFTQVSGGMTFVLSVGPDHLLTIQDLPIEGSETAVNATFRVYNADWRSRPAAAPAAPAAPGGLRLGSELTIEPFALPGLAVANSLTVGSVGPYTLFNIVPGLDGSPGSVSLELRTRPGCYVATVGIVRASQRAQVRCQLDPASRRAASFVQVPPLRQYHPMAFAARGVDRNFVVEPLMTMKDEYYTVYFYLTD